MTDALLIKIINQLKRIADALEGQNKIAKLKINLSEAEIDSIDTSANYGGTNGE